MNKFGNQLFTLTWGCQSKNHVGMEKIGNGLSERGFSENDLEEVKRIFENEKYKCILYDLNQEIDNIPIDVEKAQVLVIKNGVSLFANPDKLYEYLKCLDWDKKYYDVRRQKVLNKLARYNLIFSDFNQKADYENKQGSVYDINDNQELKNIKLKLNSYFGEEFKNLECEGNYYYNLKKCGIGYHGDVERKKVIGMRFGESCDLKYWWYYQNKRINKRINICLEHGDMYIMNFKATGNDWKKKNLFTLRHATGCEKYVK